MKLIKRHKGLAIICLLTLILLIIIFVIFGRMLFSTGKTEYGDRLNNIVEIPSKTTEKVTSDLEKMTEVSEVTIRTQGKIVYVIITFTESTKKDRAKEIAKKTLEYYDEDIIACYDFEYLLTQTPILDDEGNNKAYTIAGTKHPDNDYISWTKN